MTAFTLPIKILFQHCDPAGIVFYPRFFEMINQTVEAWFDDALSYPFVEMQFEDNRGVPTVTIQTDFKAVARLGETLTFSLRVLKLGRTSVSLEIIGRGEDDTRLIATPVLVYMDKATGRPVPWKETTRSLMAPFLIGPAT